MTAARPMIESDDEHWMRLALRLAAKGQGKVEPNPMVGCVLVKDGTCVGQGFHHFFGGPHAEVDALQSLASSAQAVGATAYVTLEPCCHHGKTPPCTQALIRSKVARVVIAMQDPFPQVDGGGIGQLRHEGIRVDLGLLGREAESLNAPYLKRLRTGWPWIIAKWAMTADGRVATVSGESQWISGTASRQEVHQLRGRVDAILVGMGTVQADDPMLTARIPDMPSGTSEPARLATRVVLCRTRLPSEQAKLIRTATQIPTWIFVSPKVNPAQLSRLEAAGAVGIRLRNDDPHDMVHQTLDYLGDQSMTNVMIEAGPEVMASFFGVAESDARPGSACLVDEFHVYLGAKLFGGQSAPGPIAGSGFGRVATAPELSLQSVDRFGDDVRMIYRRKE